jgi:hypothetical protein
MDKAIGGTRIWTRPDGTTTIGRFEAAGTLVRPGEDSIVPPGCTRYIEGPAVSVVLRSFPAGFTSGYHNDPPGQHQLTFSIAGIAEGDCQDGTRFRMQPGDFASVEDPVGTGHSARDGGGTGFVHLFVARPAPG